MTGPDNTSQPGGLLAHLRARADEYGEVGPTDVLSAADALGVELRGEEGHPFCCGDRMTVKGGIFGVDYASCETCGNYLYRIDSPHTNGGHVLSDEGYAELGDRIWMARPPVPAGVGPQETEKET